jgi:hypothetical protein
MLNTLRVIFPEQGQVWLCRRGHPAKLEFRLTKSIDADQKIKPVSILRNATLTMLNHSFNAMIIGVAGPYSADTAQQRQQNLDAMNDAAARLLAMGHIPIIGMNAALPVLERSSITNRYEATMAISLAVISACEGILLLAESPGANKERDLIVSKGLPVYHSIEEVPAADLIF